MHALIMLFMVPLMLLNWFGGIVSGIWLALLGEWWAIGLGIAGLVFSHFFLGLVLMPGLLFGLPATALIEKGKLFLAIPLLLLSQLYTYAIITGWCLLAFFVFVSEATRETFWPLLIWSYGAALGPWMFMAAKDQQAGAGSAAAMTTFFAQVAYIVIGLVVIFARVSLIDLAFIFGGIMIVGLVIETVLAIASSVAERSRASF